MDSVEGGMNPVTLTIINPRREYCPCQGLNQQPPVLKSCTLLTELWDSATQSKKKEAFKNIALREYVGNQHF